MMDHSHIACLVAGLGFHALILSMSLYRIAWALEKK